MDLYLNLYLILRNQIYTLDDSSVKMGGCYLLASCFLVIFNFEFAVRQGKMLIAEAFMQKFIAMSLLQSLLQTRILCCENYEIFI